MFVLVVTCHALVMLHPYVVNHVMAAVCTHVVMVYYLVYRVVYYLSHYHLNFPGSSIATITLVHPIHKLLHQLHYLVQVMQ